VTFRFIMLALFAWVMGDYYVNHHPETLRWSYAVPKKQEQTRGEAATNHQPISNAGPPSSDNKGIFQAPEATVQAGDHTDREGQKQITIVIPPRPFWDAGISDVVIGCATVVLAAFAGLQLLVYLGLRREAVITNQAHVFSDAINSTAVTLPQGDVVQWLFFPVWKNNGNTPARKAIVHCSRYVSNDAHGLPVNFDYPDQYDIREPTEPAYVTLGPHSQITDGPKTFEIGELVSIQQTGRRFFIYGWIEYDDSFKTRRRHRTEFCFEVLIVSSPRHNPGIHTFRIPVYGRHNGIDDECYRPIGERARQVLPGQPSWPPEPPAPLLNL
jgi:hypothetical protein